MGSVPTYVPDWTVHRAEAFTKAENITATSIERTFVTIFKSFTQDGGKGMESDSTSSSGSSMDGSESGQEHEGHPHELLVVARSTFVAHGKAPSSLVHQVAPDDDKDITVIKLMYKSRLNLESSTMETAEKLKLRATSLAPNA